MIRLVCGDVAVATPRSLRGPANVAELGCTESTRRSLVGGHLAYCQYFDLFIVLYYCKWILHKNLLAQTC